MTLPAGSHSPRADPPPPEGPSTPTGRALLVAPVPEPGDALAAALAEWDVVAAAQEPVPVDLPRPWDPATCTIPVVRSQLWEWLDQFVCWVNEQCLWDPGDLIPPCWPQHPHLVHEVAVLAVQRRQAGSTAAADALEHWQTYTLPTFLTRSHQRLRRHCDTGHQPNPATAALIRHQAPPAVTARAVSIECDLTASAADE